MARHIPGQQNNIEDALSRFQISHFRQLAPQADFTSHQCPIHLHKKVEELHIIILFILDCMESQMAVASIKKHIAGIIFKKLLGKISYSKAQIVKQILKGKQHKEGKTDTIKPITMVMMVKLIEHLELVSPSKKATGGLEMPDVQLTERKVKITIRKSKTDVSSKGTILWLGPFNHMGLCPFKAFTEFIQIQGNQKFQFIKVLKLAIKEIGLNPNDYGSHSFQIGAATHLALCGYKET
ncbi:hypothetical protein XELAEV_18015602mg [Xenopus laevis]|uniref:Tyr recombinase domain-containing protein n=1 Tax=Xenopus laevis TaxID=8355 RepID=A0A974DK63_XENLA|nr:hypothetical protein XELAEV_18015602mg [Xenopus laevis]